MIINIANADMDSPIDILFDYYAEKYPINNDDIWEKNEKLQHLLSEFPQQNRDAILEAVGLLIAGHEQEAFIRGIQTGVRLSKDLERP